MSEGAQDPQEEDEVVYPVCEGLGLTKRKLEAALSDESGKCLHRPDVLSNKLVLELSSLKTELDLAWTSVISWIAFITDTDVTSINTKATVVKIQRLKFSRAKLLKNKDKDGVESLLCKYFEIVCCNPPVFSPTDVDSVSSPDLSMYARSSSVGDRESASHPDSPSFTLDAPTDHDLHEEVLSTQEAVQTLKNRLRNVRKKLSRRDKEIERRKSHKEELEGELDHLQEDLSSMQSVLGKSKKRLSAEHERVYYHRRKSDASSAEYTDHDTIASLKQDLRQSKTEISELRQALDDAFARLEEKCIIETKIQGSYTDEVRACCHELLAMNVGVWNVPAVIRSVLDMVGLKAGSLPSVGLLSQMLVEMKHVSLLHVAEELEGEENTTLHSDGTSKFGKKYGAYQIATKERIFSVGLVNMKCGTADHTLEKLKEVLQSVTDSCGKIGKKGVGEKVIAGIKNTMSDRCIVQKNFNELLQKYRAEILPEVVSGWRQMGENEQADMLRMNNFFCALHYIVGLADQAGKTLKEWEKLRFGEEKFGATEVPRIYETSESRVVRLIRTTTSAVEKHGNEQAGAYAGFQAYISQLGLPSHLADFRGNRNYVVFYNGVGIYLLHEALLHFLSNVHGETNLLLKAVRADLSVPDLVAGARALGLLCKLATAPLWRVLEDRSQTIFDMSVHYTELHGKLVEWATDASPLLEGSAKPFTAAVVPLSDPYLSQLLEPHSSDATTQELLQLLCGSFASFTARLLAEHLPGGTFNTPTPELMSEASSVRSTNAVSERDFAQLDRLLREKPNASTIALEGMIAFANNHTADWLKVKSIEESGKILASARKSAQEMRHLYKCRQEEIQKYRLQELERKEKEIAEKKEKEVRKKEELTQAISKYGGLWTSTADVERTVLSIKTISEQRAALRAQLLFRKFVLQQSASAEKFSLSKAGKQLSIQQLSENLLFLLPSVPASPVPGTPLIEPPAKRPLEPTE